MLGWIGVVRSSGADHPGGIANRNGIFRYFASNHRPGPDNAFSPDAGHDQGAVAYPAVLADIDAFECSSLLLHGFVETVDMMLLVTAHDMDAAGDHGVPSYVAHADIALRADIDAGIDAHISMREKAAEINPDVRLAFRHRCLVKSDSEVTTECSRH